jgi:mono/diheme cytochrome c family protein
MTTKNFPLGAIAVALLGSLLGPGAARAETAQIGVPSNGALLFRVSCVSCHGVDGHGQGPLAPQLAVPPGDLRDPAFLSTRSNADLMAVIARGGGALKRSKTMPAFPTISDLDRWDIVSFLRQSRLKVADFYPSARFFTAKSYPLDKNAKERLAALLGLPVAAQDSRMTVVTAYGKRAASDAAGPELVPQDPVSLDKLSPKEKIGYLVFVELPGQGGEMTSYGVALAKDGSVTRVSSEPGLTKPALDAAYQVFVGQGQKGQPGSLKPGKAPPSVASAFKSAYARILESIGLFDKEERDRHWAD